jgi:hypothetical protein
MSSSMKKKKQHRLKSLGQGAGAVTVNESFAAIDFLKRKFEELLKGVDLCVSAKVITPALILVYSGIDVAGWLYAIDPASRTGPRFIAWVTRYLLPAGELDVTARELYGARCGLLHNFGAESYVHKPNSGVRKIQYAWGTSSAADLIELAKIVEMDAENTAIKVEELISAFRVAVAHFFDDAATDPQIARTLVTRSAKVLGSRSNDDVQELLRWGKALVGEPRSK